MVDSGYDFIKYLAAEMTCPRQYLSFGSLNAYSVIKTGTSF